VHDIMISQLNTFKTDALSVFNEVVPIALAVFITIAVTLMAIRWFMHLSGASKVAPSPTDFQEDEDYSGDEMSFWNTKMQEGLAEDKELLAELEGTEPYHSVDI
jgi:hypothetical protein